MLIIFITVLKCTAVAFVISIKICLFKMWSSNIFFKAKQYRLGFLCFEIIILPLCYSSWSYICISFFVVENFLSPKVSYLMDNCGL